MVYNEQQARARLLAELPLWELQEGHLRRVYRTGGWKASLMVVNAIGHLAEAAWHHPDIQLSYYTVTVMLRTHKLKGLTDRDFALAKKIEEVIGWQPAKENSPLRGTPNHEQGFKYLEYDEPPSV